MNRFLTTLFLTAGISTAAIGVSCAAETWSFPAYSIKPMREKGTAHTPLPPIGTFTAMPAEGHAKKNLCLLMPQTKDVVFMAYIYGATDEAKRLGQAITVFDAGGYEHDADQRSQFENCVTLGADAILLEPINPSGWETDLARARKAGIKIINVTEGVDAPVDARVLVDYRVNGGLLGEKLAKAHPAGTKPVHTLILPGAAGVQFVEDTVEGFKSKVAGSAVVVDKVIYADMSDTEQLKAIEDALVAYPEVDYIVANAMAAKQAVNVLAQRGLDKKVKIFSTYLDPDVLAYLKAGKIEASSAESNIYLKRIGVNLAVAAIEGKGGGEDLVPKVRIVTPENANDPTLIDENFPPANWTPTFKVD